MFLSTILPVALAISLASASSGVTTSEANQKCGNGQIVSCCNTSSSQGNGLDILTSLLGGNCSPLSVNGVGGQVPLEQQCTGNQAACCTGDQNGLINIQCTPIDI